MESEFVWSGRPSSKGVLDTMWASNPLLALSATLESIWRLEELLVAVTLEEDKEAIQMALMGATPCNHGRSNSSLHDLPTGQTGVFLQVGYVL